MRKQCTRIAMAALASATLLWAGGFWDKKGYTDWSEKDVKKMLNQDFHFGPGTATVYTLYVLGHG